jgi:hypothetical protein
MFQVFLLFILSPVSCIILQSVNNLSVFFIASHQRNYRSTEFLSLNLSVSQTEHSLFHSLSQHRKKIDICLVLDGIECFCLYEIESIFSFQFPLQSLSYSRCVFPDEARPAERHFNERSSRARRLNRSHYLSMSIYYDNPLPSQFHSPNDNRLVISSSPLFLSSSSSHQKNQKKLTLVLTLAFSDVSRAMILLDSFRILSNETETSSSKVFLSASSIYEMLIIIPDSQEELLQRAFRGFQEVLSFPVHFIAENYLFHRSVEARRNQDPYATQMACKLLIARYVETDNYLTLDADHILLHPLELNKLFDFSLLSTIEVDHNDSGGDSDQEEHASLASPTSSIVLPAVYHYEEYAVHSVWWDGSRNLLDADNIPSERLAFGVTPAVLNRWGSLMTLSLLKKSLQKRFSSFSESNAFFCEKGGDVNDKCTEIIEQLRQQFTDDILEKYWLESLGNPDLLKNDGSLVIWTEYTLYKIALEVYQVTRLLRLLFLCNILLFSITIFFFNLSLFPPGV